MAEYLDFLGPMQVGANLMATRQNLMLQRERSRLEAQRFLEDTLQSRALEDYRNRALEMQASAQKRMADELALNTRREQRYEEAQKLAAQRQTQADQKQSMFFRTMAGLAPVLGQRGAAQAAAVLTGWMSPQIASDLLTSQGAQRPTNLGSRKIIDPMSQQVIAEIPFTSAEERDSYIASLNSNVEPDIIRDPNNPSRFIPNPAKHGTGAGTAPTSPESPPAPVTTRPPPVSEVTVGGETVKRPRAEPITSRRTESSQKDLQEAQEFLFNPDGSLKDKWKNPQKFPVLLQMKEYIDRLTKELGAYYE